VARWHPHRPDGAGAAGGRLTRAAARRDTDNGRAG